MAKKRQGIPFYHSWGVAQSDSKYMQQYLDGEITMHMLCRMIAFNNHLDEVTEEQMQYELKACGYVANSAY